MNQSPDPKYVLNQVRYFLYGEAIINKESSKIYFGSKQLYRPFNELLASLHKFYSYVKSDIPELMSIDYQINPYKEQISRLGDNMFIQKQLKNQMRVIPELTTSPALLNDVANLSPENVGLFESQLLDQIPENRVINKGVNLGKIPKAGPAMPNKSNGTTASVMFKTMAVKFVNMAKMRQGYLEESQMLSPTIKKRLHMNQIEIPFVGKDAPKKAAAILPAKHKHTKTNSGTSGITPLPSTPRLKAGLNDSKGVTATPNTDTSDSENEKDDYIDVGFCETKYGKYQPGEAENIRDTLHGYIKRRAYTKTQRKELDVKKFLANLKYQLMTEDTPGQEQRLISTTVLKKFNFIRDQARAVVKHKFDAFDDRKTYSMSYWALIEEIMKYVFNIQGLTADADPRDMERFVFNTFNNVRDTTAKYSLFPKLPISDKVWGALDIFDVLNVIKHARPDLLWYCIKAFYGEMKDPSYFVYPTNIESHARLEWFNRPTVLVYKFLSKNPIEMLETLAGRNNTYLTVVNCINMPLDKLAEEIGKASQGGRWIVLENFQALKDNISWGVMKELYGIYDQDATPVTFKCWIIYQVPQDAYQSYFKPFTSNEIDPVLPYWLSSAHSIFLDTPANIQREIMDFNFADKGEYSNLSELEGNKDALKFPADAAKPAPKKPLSTARVWRAKGNP